MRLNDYKMSSDYDKRKWLDSYKIMSGLPYFGGKAYIGKYLINRICNMAVQMDNDGNRADIFIDVFGGGGKIALSIPEGWFDTIVLNDINYGITSFFSCCKECPDDLIALIEKLGEVMDEDLFHVLAFIRSNDGIKDFTNDKEIKKHEKYQKYEEILFTDRIDPLLSAAATYWVTKLDFMGVTDPLKVSYKADIADNKSETIGRQKEKEKIANIVKYAKRSIYEVCHKMRKNNIIVERLDFRELVKKYNGKPFETLKKEKQYNEEYSTKNVLWYMDSPYHPSTLSGGNDAPYEDTFNIELVSKMTQIIHNDDIETYGEIDYFIKSDYDPKETFCSAMEEIEKYIIEKGKLESAGVSVNDKEKNSDKPTSEAKRLKVINDYLKKLEEKKNIITTAVSFCGKDMIPFHHFDCLEDNSEYIEGSVKPLGQRTYFKECLGEFPKGVTNEITGERVMGKEYIWFKGMDSPYTERKDENISNSVLFLKTKNRIVTTE